MRLRFYKRIYNLSHWYAFADFCYCFKSIVSCMSKSLYHYLCKHVIGTENHVNTIRLMNAVCDNLSDEDYEMMITGGSFGQEMRGSDWDLMFVSNGIKVHDENKNVLLNPTKSYSH